MKKAVIGILAHVDAGKTTLSEGLLYLSGSIRKFGRVDHQDAFLDNFSLERQRGITIFFKTGRPDPGGSGGHPAGYPWTRGFFRGDGAHPPGAGLRCPGGQRHRWRSGAHPVPSGGCWNGIRSPPSSLSTRWICPVRMPMPVLAATAHAVWSEGCRRLLTVLDGCLLWSRRPCSEEAAMDEYLEPVVRLSDETLRGLHSPDGGCSPAILAPPCGWTAWKSCMAGLERWIQPRPSGLRISAPRSIKSPGTPKGYG